MQDPAPSKTGSRVTGEDDVTLVDDESAASRGDESAASRGDDGATRQDAPQSLEPRRAPSSPPSSLREGLREGLRESTGSSRGAYSRATSLVTPRETLHAQEIARTRIFVKLAFGLAVAVALSMVVLPGDKIAKLIVFACTLAVMGATTWLGIVIRTDEGYTIERAVFVGFVCIFAAYAGIYFFGVESPAPAVIPFGLCVFSSSLSNRGTLTVWLTCAFLQAALSIGVTTGMLVDRGMVRGDHLGTLEHVVILALLEAIFAATFFISRASRNETLIAN